MGYRISLLCLSLTNLHSRASRSHTNTNANTNTNSIKRDIGHLCRDEVKPPATSTTSSASSLVTPKPNQPVVSLPGSQVQGGIRESLPENTFFVSSSLSRTDTILEPSSSYPYRLSSGSSQTLPLQQPTSATSSTGPSASQWPIVQQQQQQQQPTWGSETLGNEFSVLT